MTVKEFIEIIKKAKDIDIAPILFSCGEQYFELKSIGQFSICADVTVQLREIEMPILSKAIIRSDKQKMVTKKIKEIKSKS